ncbi:MAG TPA: cation-translocating P-type ATPase [Candidatus Methanoperedens sp.]|nr:cation-translocating P-type ATPase [Candidatus Methanoperedens sp.]
MDSAFDLKKISGLSNEEVKKILERDGFNELEPQSKDSFFKLLWRVLSEPMLILLIVCGGIYLFMGEAKDAIILLCSVFFITGITFYQERKTEKTLEALKKLSSPRALVIREGKQIRIAGREVVCGDIMVVGEGDRVPADAVLLSCENLSVDESLLTGESVPVRKVFGTEDMKQAKPGGDDLPFIYSGSLVVGGHGVAKVLSTGVSSEIGKIGKSLSLIKDEDTLLHKETAKIVRYVAIIGVFLCVLVVLYYVIAKGTFVTGLLAGLTLAMAILPEEFPIVLVVFLTLGAWRISKRKVLTRRNTAIETLGAATVLCTDKTGTLTLNQMKLTSLFSQNSFYEIEDSFEMGLPEKFHELMEFGILASQVNPFDPIEKELNRVGDLYLDKSKHLHKSWNLIKEYPLSKKMLTVSHVWKSPSEDNYVVAAKGAPEAIFELCHLNSREKFELLKRVKEMSDRGLRVLGGAKAIFSNKVLPSSQSDFKFEFVGLYGFVDPVRKSAFGAVKEAYMAGMRVIVVTGDYPGTAQYVANKIGIKNADIFISGEELEKMSEIELSEKIKTVNVFARIVPEQKLMIVNSLKNNGEIVAMTGDGVNDAPALKAAHIGIAMGERGTDVAREAADLVLLNDDFSSIVEAVRLGRRIYNNLRRAMGYLLAVHVPIAGMSMLPLFFGYPIVLLPAHIVFFEMIIDPACATVFESEKEDSEIMNRPPRRLNEPLFNWRLVLINLLQGVGVLLVTFALYFWAINTGRGEMEARSFAFTAMVLGNILMIIINLSWTKNIIQILMSANRALLIVLLWTILCLLVVLYIPFFSKIFYLKPFSFEELLLTILIVAMSLSWFEGLKLVKVL